MNMEETQTSEMYGDNEGVKGKPDEPPEDLEPNPYLLMDVYVNASIALPRGDNISRGGSFLGNKTSMATQLDAITRIQSLIHILMKWNSKMVK